MCKNEGCPNETPAPDIVNSKRLGKHWRHRAQCHTCTNLRHSYGIDNGERLRMLNNQEWCCAICKQEIVLQAEPKNTTSNTAVVDHIAGTKIVRGMLCSSCNRAIGLLKHSTTNLTNAISYLEEEK